MLEDVPQISNGVQLSIVQGYMSRFYRLLPWYNLVAIKIFWIVFLRINSWYDYPQWCFRKYGTWVARNPILVLCSSLAVILIFCLGLIRFQVETRPEKVCLNNLVFDTAAFQKSVFTAEIKCFIGTSRLYCHCACYWPLIDPIDSIFLSLIHYIPMPNVF